LVPEPVSGDGAPPTDPAGGRATATTSQEARSIAS